MKSLIKSSISICCLLFISVITTLANSETSTEQRVKNITRGDAPIGLVTTSGTEQEELRYLFIVNRSGKKDLRIKDDLPAEIKYQPNSSEIFVNETWRKIADDTDHTPYPFDSEGYFLPNSNSDYEFIRFEAHISNKIPEEDTIATNIHYLFTGDQLIGQAATQVLIPGRKIITPHITDNNASTSSTLIPSENSPEKITIQNSKVNNDTSKDISYIITYATISFAALLVFIYLFWYKKS